MPKWNETRKPSSICRNRHRSTVLVKWQQCSTPNFVDIYCLAMVNNKHTHTHAQTRAHSRTFEEKQKRVTAPWQKENHQSAHIGVMGEKLWKKSVETANIKQLAHKRKRSSIHIDRWYDGDAVRCRARHWETIIHTESYMVFASQTCSHISGIIFHNQPKQNVNLHELISPLDAPFQPIPSSAPQAKIYCITTFGSGSNTAYTRLSFGDDDDDGWKKKVTVKNQISKDRHRPRRHKRKVQKKQKTNGT